MTAAQLGNYEYSLLFHEDGTVKLVIAGADIPGLTWVFGKAPTEAGEVDGIVINYYTQALYIVPTEKGCDMDYFGRDDVIPMWVADMDFACAPCVVEAVQKRAAHPIYGYGMRQQPYYDAVMGWLKKRHGFEVKYEHLAFAPPGVIYALNVMLRILTKPGDRVMVPMPNYDPLFDMVTRGGRKLVETPLVWKDGRYTFDFADMEAKAASGVKVLVLSSPHNPTGRIWTEEELRRMAEIIGQNRLWVVSDEIHCDLNRTGLRRVPMGKVMQDYERLITCISTSKTFNLAGLLHSNIIIRSAQERARFQARDKNIGVVWWTESSSTYSSLLW